MLLLRNNTYLQKLIIFQPWVDCAMEKQCIAADGLVRNGCDLHKMGALLKRETESGSINPIFYGCHHFDLPYWLDNLAKRDDLYASLFLVFFYQFFVGLQVCLKHVLYLHNPPHLYIHIC